MTRWRGLLTVTIFLVGCSRGAAKPVSTTYWPTTTQPVTTTTMEHEAITALRAYFDAYAVAVQKKGPDLILAYLDQENREIVKSVTDSVRQDIANGRSGTRTIAGAWVEFERPTPQGLRSASVRALYASDEGARPRSFAFVNVSARWLLTAIADEGFRQ